MFVAAEGHGLKKDNRDDDVLTFSLSSPAAAVFVCKVNDRQYSAEIQIQKW